MGSSSVIAGREAGSIVGLEGTIKSLEIDATFQPDGPHVHLAVNLEGLSIWGKQPVLSLRLLSIQSRVRFLSRSSSFTVEFSETDEIFFHHLDF